MLTGRIPQVVPRGLNPYPKEAFNVLLLTVDFAEWEVETVVQSAWKAISEVVFGGVPEKSQVSVFGSGCPPLDLYLDEHGRLTIPHSKSSAIMDFLYTQSVLDADGEIWPALDLWPPFDRAGVGAGQLVALLVKGKKGQPGELYEPAPSNRYPIPLVGAVVDGTPHWANVVARAIGQKFASLLDEFELEGPEFAEPPEGYLPRIRNLYFATAGKRSTIAAIAAGLSQEKLADVAREAADLWRVAFPPATPIRMSDADSANAPIPLLEPFDTTGQTEGGFGADPLVGNHDAICRPRISELGARLASIAFLFAVLSCASPPGAKPVNKETSHVAHGQWPVRLNGDHVIIRGAALQPSGSVLLTGVNRGPVSLCGTTSGVDDRLDGFLVKLSSSGECLWANRRTTFAASGIQTTSGPSGEIYWAGEDCADCESGRRAFLERLDNEGRTLWTFSASVSGPEASLSPTSLIVTNQGPALSLRFRGTMEIGFATTLTSKGDERNQDAVVLQFTTDGSLAWLAQFGGPGEDRITALAPLPDGQILATGELAPTTSCERPPGQPRRTDAFVAQFKEGKVVNCRALRSSLPPTPTSIVDSSIGLGIASDTLGNFLITGTYEGPFEINGKELHCPTCIDKAPWPDLFVVSYDVEQRVRWAKRLNLHHASQPSSVVLDRGEAVVAIQEPASLIRLDEQGRILWQRALPKEVSLGALSTNSCGTTMVAGYSTTGGTEEHPEPRYQGFTTILNREGFSEEFACRQ